MTIATWVVGGSGLLGSALTTELASDPQSIIVRQTVRWADDRHRQRDLANGTTAWLGVPGATSFRLIWAAGAGVTSTQKTALDDEAATFRAFATLLGAELGKRRIAPSVSLFLASSAGGVYSGGEHPPFTESSAPLPLSHYGETKLAMEHIVTELADFAKIRVLIGRISNLYGPGQQIDKQQGFVSQLCQSMLARRPMSIYVSLDTMRDYIYVDDAAAVIHAAIERLEREGTAGTSVIKNIASHSPATLGGVLHDARMVFKRKPEVVLARSPMAAGQTRDLRIGSTVWPELNDLPRRSLLIGMAQTRASMELQARARGVARVSAN